MPSLTAGRFCDSLSSPLKEFIINGNVLKQTRYAASSVQYSQQCWTKPSVLPHTYQQRRHASSRVDYPDLDWVTAVPKGLAAVPQQASADVFGPWYNNAPAAPTRIKSFHQPKFPRPAPVPNGNLLRPGHKDRLLSLLRLDGQASCPQDDAVFISFDCEYDSSSSFRGQLTKFGVAVLDTRAQEGWISRRSLHVPMEKISACFYRPTEFCSGEKRWRLNDFRYGQSTLIRSEDMPNLVQRIFRDPSRIFEAANFNVDIEDTHRRIVLVGHALHIDLRLLSKLEIYPEKLANIVYKFDTEACFVRPGRLLDVLNATGIKPMAVLHNAGNDAVMTLLALLTAAKQARYNVDPASPKVARQLTFRGQVARWNLGGTATKGDLPQSILPTLRLKS